MQTRRNLQLHPKAKENPNELEIQLKRRLDSAIRKLEVNPHIGKPLRGELGQMEPKDWRLQDHYTINEREKTVTLYNARHRKVAYE